MVVYVILHLVLDFIRRFHQKKNKRRLASHLLVGVVLRYALYSSEHSKELGTQHESLKFEYLVQIGGPGWLLVTGYCD